MKNTDSTDYHDYVIKDGRLIGEFEKMYQCSSEIPWHQDLTAFQTFSNIDIDILRQKRYESICEIGCGLGFFTNRLRNELLNHSGNSPLITGVDVSQTAITQAGQRYPDIDFKVLDIRTGSLPKAFDRIICKEIMWYVFPQINDVINNIRSMLSEEGYVYISQTFPESEIWVGKDVIGSPTQLREIFTQHFTCQHYCVEWDAEYHNRPLVHLLMKRDIA